MSLVGCYVGLSKLLVAALPLFLLAWLRFAIAAVAMLGWLRRAEGEPPLAPQNRKLLFFESFIGNFLFSICMLYGVRHTSAVAAGVVMAAMPAAVALLSRMMLREPITRRVALAIGCAAAGIAWLALLRMPAGASGSAATAPWWGYALLLAAVFCEAFYVVAGKRLTANVSPRRISALINLWGLALMTPFGLVQAIDFDFGSVAPPMWLLLVFYALAASMVTVWLWMRGLQQVPASKAGVFAVLLPLSAALVGVLWLDEAFGAGHAGAFALALAGLLLAVWPPRPAR